MSEENKNEPEYEIVTDEAHPLTDENIPDTTDTVVEHKTKVVDSKKALELGELLVIKCTVCNEEHLYGRQNRKGEYLPDAFCPHVLFLGVKKFD